MAIATAANKPIILGEFGHADASDSAKAVLFGEWLNAILPASTPATGRGALHWQLLCVENEDCVYFVGWPPEMTTTYPPQSLVSNALQTAATRANNYPPPGNTHVGSWAMRAVTTATQTWNNAWQFPSVAASSSYVAGCWLKGTGAVELRIFAGQWGTPIANQTFTATSSWQFFPLNNPVNTGSNTQLTFNLTDSSGNAGTTYVDDCFLGLPGGANRLANPGFESGATAWSLNGTPFTILQNP